MISNSTSSPDAAYLSAWPPIPGTFPDKGRAWPKISIVTPNYNEEKTLERTILSITEQQYPNLEYIVMDDGSRDGSADIIRRHEHKLAHWETHENCGQYPTINKGFSRATGEIFGWLNSDDIYLPWTLHAVADIFLRFPDIDWIMGLPATIQNGVVHRVRQCRAYPQEMLRMGMFGGVPLGVVQQESCFWRRKVWEQSGELDTRWKRAADFELWTRFARHAPLVCCDLLLTGFTRTGKNRSTVHASAYLEEVRSIQHAIKERLTAGERRQRQKIERGLAAYARARHFSPLKFAAVKIFGLERYRGPVLQRAFETQQMERTSEPCVRS